MEKQVSNWTQRWQLGIEAAGKMDIHKADKDVVTKKSSKQNMFEFLAWSAGGLILFVSFGLRCILILLDRQFLQFASLFLPMLFPMGHLPRWNVNEFG